MRYSFTAELWQYPGQAAWHFVTLPKDMSEEIKQLTHESRRGFGSVRVGAQIRKAEFRTSIFPDSRSGCFMLPIKKTVRIAQKLQAGDIFAVDLTIEV